MLAWLLSVWTWIANELVALTYRDIGAIVGPMAAAYFGAYSAQRIIERRESRQRILKELRSLSVASSLAFHIANTYFNIKKQHVRQLHDAYHVDKEKVREILATPGPKPVYRFKADLGYLAAPVVPIDQVQSIVATEISARGRPLVLPSMIAQAVRSLTESLLLRNNLVTVFKAHNLTFDEFAIVYFGLETERGVDDRYGQTVDAIHKYTDDCIHFSVLLSKDLAKHATELQRQYKERFKENAPGVSKYPSGEGRLFAEDVIVNIEGAAGTMIVSV